MSRLALGVLLGLGCAVLASLVMIPMKFPTRGEKKRAIIGAFLNRFVLGFVVANIVLPLPGVAAGAVLGLAVSAADAVITKAYAPILAMGTAMGALCGWIVSVAPENSLKNGTRQNFTESLLRGPNESEPKTRGHADVEQDLSPAAVEGRAQRKLDLRPCTQGAPHLILRF